MKSAASETKRQARRKLAGFSLLGEAKEENQSLIFAQLCWILADDVIVLFSTLVLNVYPGFWYVTRVVACIA